MSRNRSSPQKENSLMKVRRIPVTEPGEQVMGDISHKIVNEILNQEEQSLLTQLDGINDKINQSQMIIKGKIQSLIGDNNKLLNYNEASSEFNSLQSKITLLEEQKQDILKKNQSLIKQIKDITNEERYLYQYQQEIDRQQNQAYDYFELEFNKLKETYEGACIEQARISEQKNTKSEKYSQLLECKAAIKEDLNARLLQRAELVAQKEELEQLIEHFQSQNHDVYDLAQVFYTSNNKIRIINQNMEQIDANIEEMGKQKQQKEAQLQKFTQVLSLETQMVQTCGKIRGLKNKLIVIQKSLNLPHPDSQFNDFFTKWDGTELQLKLANYIQQLKVTLFKQNSNQAHKLQSINEYLVYLEQYLILSTVNHEIQDQILVIREELKQCSDYSQIQSDLSKLDFELSMLREEFSDCEEQKEMVLQQQQRYWIQSIDSKIEDYLKIHVERAFEVYKTENKSSLFDLQTKYSKDEYQTILQDTYNELFELLREQEYNKLQGLLQLIEKFNLQEKTIKINISAVDDQLLPRLKELLTEISKLRKEIDILAQNEQPYLVKMSQLEGQIPKLENEFKQKIDQFQKQEEENQERLKEIKTQIIQQSQQQDINKIQLQQISFQQRELQKNQMQFEECMYLLNDRKTKSHLESEIVEINNAILNYQQQKKRIEMILEQMQRQPKSKSPVRKFNFASRKNSGKKIQFQQTQGSVLKDSSTLSRSLNTHPLNNKIKPQNLVSVFSKVTPKKLNENEYMLKHYSSNKILPRNIENKVFVKYSCGDIPTPQSARSKQISLGSRNK